MSFVIDVDFVMDVQAAVAREGLQELADRLRVSRPTVERWLRGENLPHSSIREMVRKAASKP